MKTGGHLFEDIRRLFPGRCYADIPLSRFTSFGIGGLADIVVEPENVACLAELIRHLHDRGIPRIILGAGTNVLFPDSGFRGVVIRTNCLKNFGIKTNGSDSAMISAGAGVNLFTVIGRTCLSGFTGLEPLWGIPGSLGGAVAVNAGSGGVCACDFLEQVVLLTYAGNEIRIKKTDLDFGYRRMKLPADSVIVEGTFRLVNGVSGTIKGSIRAAMKRRRTEQPWRQPSAGCVFRNPSLEKPAGAMIDRLGFKGVQVGGAQVSEIHANFIINRGNALASDVLELVHKIRERVREAEGIELELEICVITQDQHYD